MLSWCYSFNSHLGAGCVFPYFLCVLWCHSGRARSKIDPRQCVTDQVVWLADVFCEHIVFVCELACLFVWCAAQCLPSFFINCEYLDLLDSDLTSDVQMSPGVSAPRDAVNRVADLPYLHKNLLPQCQSSSVFPLLYLSLRFPAIRLPLLPPHGVQVCPKSLFDRKRGRRGDIEWDKGGREIDREKIEGWGFEHTWNEPINPERLLSRVKCLSQADA